MRKSRNVRLANLLGTVATGLSDRVSTATRQAAQLDGSAPAALIALMDFAPAGSVQVLSQILGLTHSGGVRLVDRLVAEDLVERLPGEDARSITVALTSHGREVAERVRQQRFDAIADTMTGLSDGQREALLEACEVLVANLTAQRLAQRATGESPGGGALCRMCDFTACGRRAGRCPAMVSADD
ncbi:MarR family winged helix-turn-helix transcriptional regulator [Jatrophihabitans sp. DSM 45814]